MGRGGWKGLTDSGVAFSLSRVFLAVLLLVALLKMWTCDAGVSWELNGGGCGRCYVELPALDGFAGLFACDDDDELRDLAAGHPFVELGHDLLDVGFDLVVVGNWTGS